RTINHAAAAADIAGNVWAIVRCTRSSVRNSSLACDRVCAGLLPGRCRQASVGRLDLRASRADASLLAPLGVEAPGFEVAPELVDALFDLDADDPVAVAVVAEIVDGGRVRAADAVLPGSENRHGSTVHDAAARRLPWAASPLTACGNSATAAGAAGCAVRARLAERRHESLAAHPRVLGPRAAARPSALRGGAAEAARGRHRRGREHLGRVLRPHA